MYVCLCSYETFPILQPELFDRPQDQLRTPAKGSAPNSPAPRRTKQVHITIKTLLQFVRSQNSLTHCKKGL